jgi:hypothetical protein
MRSAGGRVMDDGSSGVAVSVSLLSCASCVFGEGR